MHASYNGGAVEFVSVLSAATINAINYSLNYVYKYVSYYSRARMA